jgi:hypothetical protein
MQNQGVLSSESQKTKAAEAANRRDAETRRKPKTRDQVESLKAFCPLPKFYVLDWFSPRLRVSAVKRFAFRLLVQCRIKGLCPRKVKKQNLQKLLTAETQRRGENLKPGIGWKA